ncbi:MAG: rhodanese-like domain-containing protein [Ignavibacteriaceae bacterium]|jgi:rhodanese-related sulfurtransferase|nr:rhodanese-like domain-containing protein [Ignavibacteriaceae bacterium]
MIKYFTKITGLLLILNSLTFSQQKSDNSLTMSEFKEKLKSDSNIVVLDVRTPEEFTGSLGRIESAINIPVQVLDQRIKELEKFKDKEILVICRTQNRSAVAVDYLKRAGYNAKNILGGMAEYSKK